MFRAFLIFTLILFIGNTSFLKAQFDREFATEVSFQENVNNGTNAVDGQLDTFARLTSNSGLALGIGASVGILEINFPNSIPANTSSYIKLDFDIEVLRALLGGSPSGLGTNLLQNDLFGNHTLEIQARNGNDIILSGSTATPENFTGEELRVIVDENGEFYISIKPSQTYQSIRLIDRSSALLGLGIQNSTDIFGVFIVPQNQDCIAPLFTGLNLNNFNLVNLLGTQPVEDPENILNNDPLTFSELNLTAVNQDASIEQFVIFSDFSPAGSYFSLRFRFGDDNIGTQDLSRVIIKAFDNSEQVSEQSLSDIVNAEAIQRLQNGEFVDILFQIDDPANKISISYERNSAGLGDLPSLQLASISRGLQKPEATEEQLEIEVCEGENVQLSANTADDLLLRWYDVPEGGAPLAELQVDMPFTSPEITENQIFYVASYDPNCLLESERVAISVILAPTLMEGDIIVIGNEDVTCFGDEIQLSPQLIEGVTFDENLINYRWYLDAALENEITENLQISEINFSIGNDGVLTISNLKEEDNISTFYLSIQIDNLCEDTLPPIQVPVVFAENCQEFSINKSVSQPTAMPGEVVNFSITVKNEGVRDLLDLEIRDILSNQLTFVSASVLVQLASNNTIIWKIPTLSVGQSTTLTISVRLNEGLASGTIIPNTAVGRLENDIENTKESNTVEILVTEAVMPQLEIEKSVDAEEATVNQELTYTLIVRNTGNTTLNNIEIIDQIPQNTVFQNADNGGTLTGETVTWAIELLESGESLELILVVSIEDNTQDGTIITNQAQVRSDEIPQAILSQIVETRVISDEEPDTDTNVMITKTLLNSSEVSVGSVLDFLIEITNIGTVSAENLLVQDLLSEDLLPISADGPSEIVGQLVTWNIPALVPEATLQFTLQALVREDAQLIVNSVEVSGDNFDEKTAEITPVPVQENEVNPEINLELSKAVEKPSVQVGEVFSYTLTLSNLGDDISGETGFFVVDSLPEEVEFLRIRNQEMMAEFDPASKTLIWEVPSLLSGESKTLEIEVRALEASLEVVNRAFLKDVIEGSQRIIQTVEVRHEQLSYKIANVVTPNGDGKNDSWKVQGLESFLDSWEVVIFNRYGIELHRESQYTDGWFGDGLNAGTYFYQIRGINQEGRELVLSGFITLIK
ncbi:gliding motility-associated C-terminal domain-containing protein [Belliella sp. DSM 107340]|uniref:Gliding motility-associated C-terminal domain-containing protein n=1 Tax=Belliella calami TaxID=2923436 RepID=A0ABS9UIN5_9BACT|nr:gliding motility-associated C-terminal domain-containing protein [Belliella calami]MCH7396482.1 gliding motility-associated C-terminal domain-containing protein [Belliella calami]